MTYQTLSCEQVFNFKFDKLGLNSNVIWLDNFLYCSQDIWIKSSYKSEFREYESLNIINYDMCELDGTKTRNDKMIFYHIYWWLWILENKFDMLDKENWNLCWKEYPSLNKKNNLIKIFWRKDNLTCLIFELGIVWTIFRFWTPWELNSLIEPMNVYSLGML